MIQKKISIALIVMFLLVCFNPVTTYAADKDIYGIGEELDGLGGDADYLGKNYRENYSMDAKKTTEAFNKADDIVNSLADIMFQGIRILGTLICSVIYQALNFDLAEKLGLQINTLQKSMVDGIFTPLFPLAFCGAAIALVIKFAKRDVMGTFGDLIKVLFTCVIAALVASQSSLVLTSTSELTRGVSTQIFTSVNAFAGIETDNSYSATAAGILWTDLVHEPWKNLEFGNDELSEEDEKAAVEKILSASSSERETIMKEVATDYDLKSFECSVGGGRIAMILVYLIPFLLKSGIFLIFALLQIAFSALSIIILMIAPIVLLISLLPSYGFELVQRWVKYFVNIHIGMILLTSLLAVMIWLNKFLYGMKDSIGWLVCVAIQTVICVVIFLAREHIFAFIMSKNSVANIKRLQNAIDQLVQNQMSKQIGYEGNSDMVPLSGSGYGEEFQPGNYNESKGYYWGEEDNQEKEMSTIRMKMPEKNTETEKNEAKVPLEKGERTAGYIDTQPTNFKGGQPTITPNSQEMFNLFQEEEEEQETPKMQLSIPEDEQSSVSEYPEEEREGRTERTGISIAKIQSMRNHNSIGSTTEMENSRNEPGYIDEEYTASKQRKEDNEGGYANTGGKILQYHGHTEDVREDLDEYQEEPERTPIRINAEPQTRRERPRLYRAEEEIQASNDGYESHITQNYSYDDEYEQPVFEASHRADEIHTQTETVAEPTQIDIEPTYSSYEYDSLEYQTPNESTFLNDYDNFEEEEEGA